MSDAQSGTKLARPGLRCSSAGVLLVAALVGIVNYLGMRYYHRFDWTSSQLYSLSDKTKSILAGLDRDIEVTLFLPAGVARSTTRRRSCSSATRRSRRGSTSAPSSADKNLIEAQQLVDKFQLSQPRTSWSSRAATTGG